jgi:hypothetical protein
MPLRSLTGSLLTAALAALIACTSAPEVPKGETAGAMKPLPAHGGAGTAPAPAAGLKYSAPAEWIAETPSSSMRQAQYRLPRAEGDPEDAELVVFFFKGDGGSVDANIQRWIGQFVKADGSPAADVATTTRRESHGIPITIVDVSGTYLAASGPSLAEVKNKPGYRMLAAVAEAAGGPWFFKLTGPANTVARWQASFTSFLDSLEP